MMSTAFRFDSAAFAAADGFEAYRALYAGGSDVLRAGPEFRASIAVSPFSRLVMFERRMHNLMHERTAERAGRDGFEHVTLQLVLSGAMRVSTPTGCTTVEPGEIALFDMRLPQRNEMIDARVLTFSVARDLVQDAGPRLAELHGTALRSSGTRFLADMMSNLFSRSDEIAPESAERVVRAFRELVLLAIEEGLARQQDPADAIIRVGALIEAALEAPHLTPGWLAQEAGMSRSRLYELFRELGGVEREIQKRRLARFWTLLSRPALSGAKIALLAKRSGFAAPSHASREFRAAFGITPGEFRRESAKRAHQGAQAVGPFDAWIRALN